MNCKHKIVKGDTTKYFYCQVKDKAINEYECKTCMFKLPVLPQVVEDLFGSFKGDL